MCEARERLSYCYKNKIINTIEDTICTEGPNDEQYIVKGNTKDQADQDIRAEDVVQAKNSVWYTWPEIRTWREKTIAGIPTYGNCTDCYWGGLVGMVCTHCKKKGEKKPTYQVLKVEQKILDSHLVMGYFKRGHDIAKADLKHRWIRTGTVQLPSFGKFTKMVEDGEVRGRQQVDNRSVLEKIHYHSQNTSEYIHSHNLVRNPTDLELQEEDHF